MSSFFSSQSGSETPRLALVGYPNAGKSTLFEALTGKAVERNIYPFTTLKPHTAPFILKDPWLEKIAALVKPERTTPAHFLVYDIPGLIEGASQGAGLGNQFLAEIRPAHFLIFVLRNFQKKELPSDFDPLKEWELVRTELLLSDFEILERVIEKEERRARTQLEAREKLKKLLPIKEALSQGSVPEEIPPALPLLSSKPFCVLLNGTAKECFFSAPSFTLDAQFLLDLKTLTEEEQESFPEKKMYEEEIEKMQAFILKKLHLIFFYTMTGGKEVKAHLISEKANFFTAAGHIHSDIQKGFIKAFALPVTDFLLSGSWEKARKEGKVKAFSREDPLFPDAICHFEFRV